MVKKNKPVVAVVYLGCAKNQVDSERLLGILSEAGFVPTGSVEHADAVVATTCAFIEPAVRECEDLIESIGELRSRRGTRIVVAGCLVNRFGPAELRRRFPAVDAWLDLGSFERLPAVIGDLLSGAGFREAAAVAGVADGFEERPRLLSTQSYAYLKISEGCDNRCNYCTIPMIRGPLRHRPMSALLSEARALADLGACELVLVAQDTAAYRDPVTGGGIGALVRGLASISGVEWIRIMYAHPAHVGPELLAAFRDEPKLVSYLDMPAQHSSDRVLAAMRRGYTGAHVRELVEKLRKVRPAIALRTTLMVGHPGEDDAAFEELLAFVREMQFVNVGAFVFRAEAGTKSAEMAVECSAEEAQRRLDVLMQVQQDIAFEYLDSYAGKVLDVVVEGPETARTSFQAPEVDGTVISDYAWPTGGLAKALIVQRQGYDLKGEPV